MNAQERFDRCENDGQRNRLTDELGTNELQQVAGGAPYVPHNDMFAFANQNRESGLNIAAVNNNHLFLIAP